MPAGVNKYKQTRTRSPYFVQMASTEDAVEMELRVWTGDGIADIPVAANYTLSKEVSDGAGTFEVSELIRDYVSQNSTLTSGSVWWQAKLNDGVAAQVTIKELATEGYHTYDSGLQHPAVGAAPEEICLPTDTDGSCRVTLAVGAIGTVPVNFNNTNATSWGYERFDLSGSTLGTTLITVSDAANLQVRYVAANSTVSRIEFDFNGTAQTVYFDHDDCPEYEPMRLLYVNKCGAKNYLHFTMKSSESISTSSDTFRRSLVDYSGLTNGNGLHASRKRITGSKQRFTLNTNWLAEYYVQQLEELLLSEYVWLVKTTGNPIPVNVTDSSLSKKTHLNDKLINYTIKVETASEYINTVR